MAISKINGLDGMRYPARIGLAERRIERNLGRRSPRPSSHLQPIAKIVAVTVCLIPALAHAKWKTAANVSQLDGKRTEVVGTQSINDIFNSIGKPAKATLIIRCHDRSSPEVYVMWPGFMGLSASGRPWVRWKFDSGKVNEGAWDYSDDGTAIFSSHANTLVHHIKNASRLVVDATPYERAETEAIFDLTGARAAIPTKEVLGFELCK